MYKHQSLDGISSTGLIYDKEAAALSLAGHENMEEILAVLGQSIDREDNGFRNIGIPDLEELGHGLSSVEGSSRNSQTDNPLAQLDGADSGTAAICEGLAYYLGEKRAWRNGWNIKAYQRHAKASKKAQADHGCLPVCWLADKESIIKAEGDKAQAKKDKIAAKLAALEAKQAKRKAK